MPKSNIFATIKSKLKLRLHNISRLKKIDRHTKKDTLSFVLSLKKSKKKLSYKEFYFLVRKEKPMAPAFFVDYLWKTHYPKRLKAD